MSLRLYMHPLSSYCHKVLIALYENQTAFDRRIIDLSDATSRAELEALWPIVKFPVLRDEHRNETVAESTTIIEYLVQYYPGPTQLIPGEPEHAREVRFHDRYFDLYVHQPMQKIVGDRLRAAGQKDPAGVQSARDTLRIAYDMIEKALAGKTWITGNDFSMADCAAAPALFYANKVQPFSGGQQQLGAYLDRLMQRPSYARALQEAEPYFAMFPG